MLYIKRDLFLVIARELLMNVLRVHLNLPLSDLNSNEPKMVVIGVFGISFSPTGIW